MKNGPPQADKLFDQKKSPKITRHHNNYRPAG
jgi:hypothetical protein